MLDSFHCFTQEAVGDRRVEDDSAGSIGLVRTGVRTAALTDRGGGASSTEQSDDERWARGEPGSLHPCLGPEAGSRPRSPPVGVCPERVCCCSWGTPRFLAETLMFPHGHVGKEMGIHSRQKNKICQDGEEREHVTWVNCGSVWLEVSARQEVGGRGWEQDADTFALTCKALDKSG